MKAEISIPAVEKNDILTEDVTAETREPYQQEQTPASRVGCAGLGKTACGNCAMHFTCPYLEKYQESIDNQMPAEKNNIIQSLSILENPKSTKIKKTTRQPKSYLDQLFDSSISSVMASRDKEVVLQPEPEKKIINQVKSSVGLLDAEGNLPKQIAKDLETKLQPLVEPAPETKQIITQPVTEIRHDQSHDSLDFASPNIRGKGMTNNKAVDLNKLSELKTEPMQVVVNTSETKSVKAASISSEMFEFKEFKNLLTKEVDARLFVVGKQNTSQEIRLAEITNVDREEVGTEIKLELDKTKFIAHEFSDTKSSLESILATSTIVEQTLTDDSFFNVPKNEETDLVSEEPHPSPAEYQVPYSSLVKITQAEIENSPDLVEVKLETENTNKTDESIAIESNDKYFIIHDKKVLDEVSDNIPTVITGTADYNESNKPIEFKEVTDNTELKLEPKPIPNLQLESQNVDNDIIHDYEIEELDLGFISTQYFRQSQPPLASPTNVTVAQDDCSPNRQDVFSNKLAIEEEPTSFDHLSPADMPVSIVVFDILRQLARLALNEYCL
jgi:hypothetical protein